MATDQHPYESPAADAALPAGPRQLLLGPAIGLLALSILHAFGWLFYAVYVYSIASDPEASPETARQLTIFCMYYSISILYSLLLASGAFSMLRRGSYLWATTTCVLALVPFLGPCYFFAIPFGIWGLLILRRPHVRAAFARM